MHDKKCESITEKDEKLVSIILKKTIVKLVSKNKALLPHHKWDSQESYADPAVKDKLREKQLDWSGHIVERDKRHSTRRVMELVVD